MKEQIQILDKNGVPLARALADEQRWRLPDGVGVGVKYSGQIYPLVKTAQGWVIRLGGRSFAQKACQAMDTAPPSPAPARLETAAAAPPVVARPAVRPTVRTNGRFEDQWLINAEKVEAQRAERVAHHQQANEAVAQLHGELAGALEERDRQVARARQLEADKLELQNRLRDDRRLQKSENTVADLRGQLTHAQRQVAAAQAEVRQARELQKAAEARATAGKAELTQQRQAATALEQRLKACLAETAKGARPEAWDWFQALLPVAWPRLVVRPESWDVVSRHCTRVEAVLRVLQALHDEDPDQASFSITDNGWREVQDHIATGRDDRLRVYWRPLPERTIEAVIFYKNDDEVQQAFHRALSRESARE